MQSRLPILSTAYFPPISYIATLVNSNIVYLEKHETYRKQTNRNRCHIYSANGAIPLSIPIKKPMGNRTKICDALIDNSVKWNREHWRAIESAYHNSAYLEFLSDFFVPFYQKPWIYLWDFNLALIQVILGILEVNVEIRETESFILQHGEGYHDVRDLFKSEAVKNIPLLLPYHQVFEEKYGFIPNLSILDLLCNVGMDARTWLLDLK